jgi:putative cell wall-binding protein
MYKLYMPHKSIIYYHKSGENYFTTMKNDMDWLHRHSLQSQFDFGDNDPFVIKPTTAFMKAQNGSKLDIPIQFDVEQRIKRAENVIEEESPLNPKKALGQATLLYERAKIEYTRKHAFETLQRPRTKGADRPGTQSSGRLRSPQTSRTTKPAKMARKAVKERL